MSDEHAPVGSPRGYPQERPFAFTPGRMMVTPAPAGGGWGKHAHNGAREAKARRVRRHRRKP